jgi:hypothetical protein
LSPAGHMSQQRFTHLSRLLALASGSFSVLTVVINLADVTTDVIVAAQFFRDGDELWAWLVVASLVLAHIIYVLALAWALPNGDSRVWRRFKVLPFSIRVLLVMPVAQLAPLINLIVVAAEHTATDLDPPGLRSSANLNSDMISSPRPDAPQRSVVAEEQMAQVARSAYINRRMTEGFKRHVERYALFYAESAVEAAPQAVIQLLAITFLGRASPAQLLSLCCSLFSITSKAVILCRSYDLRCSLFKFALAAFDVFSAFYLFSTLVALETVKHTSFFGAVDVSWMGYVWLWKITVYAGLALICGLILCVAFVAQALTYGGLGTFHKCKRAGEILAATTLGVIALAPALLAYEVCKMTYVTLYDIAAYGTVSVNPGIAVIASFLKGDDRDASRLRHLLRCLLVHRHYHLNRRDHHGRIVPRHEWERDVYAAYAHLNGDHSVAISNSETTLSCEMHSTSHFYSPVRAMINDYTRKLTLERLAPFVASSCRIPYNPKGISNRVFADMKATIADMCYSEHAWMSPMAWLIVVVTCIGQLVSLVYPFVNAATQFGTHNVLQATCFYAACAAGFVALATSPWGWYCYHINCVFNILVHRTGGAADRLMTWIENYFTPPHVAALQSTIAVAVLPVELTAVVAQFLAPPDVGLMALSMKECLALRQQIAERGFEDRLGTSGAERREGHLSRDAADTDTAPLLDDVSRF